MNHSDNLNIPNDSILWQYKDLSIDKIPGISLNKWYAENKNKKVNQKQIIVAVLDMQIDIKHEDLKNQIWINNNEIPSNNIDDDKNGYVDDINGWNFTGHKNKEYNVWSNFEYIRVLREWKPQFEGKIEDEINTKDLYKFKQYQRAKKIRKNYIAYYENWKNNLSFPYEVFKESKDTLKKYFKNENYTLDDLQKLYDQKKLNNKTYYERIRDKDKDLGALIDYMIANYETNLTSFEKIENQKIQLDSILKKDLNENYNDRKFINNSKEVFEKGYGNNNISEKAGDLPSLSEHGTNVSGIIAATRGNNLGVNGFHDKIKIMPLVTSCSGDEHDYDIANAIYYAVDNGAKVINMSFSKWFSIHENIVAEAIKYAEKNNVLIVHSTGNDSLPVDTFPIYPSDYSYEKKEELVANFINVGSISKKIDENLVTNTSGYGKINVDIFAPGKNIFTCFPNHKYDLISGTSFAAPMVSGTAALIWLYYPKLTAKQVKDIILESSVKYDLDVIIPGTTDKKVKFSELSKSGGVLNVYNAMLLAEKVSKQN